MTDHLAECPFCGGEPYEEQFPTLHIIGCKSCGFHIHGKGIYSDSETESIGNGLVKFVSEGTLLHQEANRKKWNTRPIEDQLRQTIEDFKIEAAPTIRPITTDELDQFCESGEKGFQEIDQLMQRVDELEKINKTACEDWAHDHTHLQQACIAAGIPKEQTEGDSYSAASIRNLTDLLAKRVKELEKENAELRRTLEQIASFGCMGQHDFSTCQESGEAMPFCHPCKANAALSGKETKG